MKTALALSHMYLYIINIIVINFLCLFFHVENSFDVLFSKKESDDHILLQCLHFGMISLAWYHFWHLKLLTLIHYLTEYTGALWKSLPPLSLSISLALFSHFSPLPPAHHFPLLPFLTALCLLFSPLFPSSASLWHSPLAPLSPAPTQLEIPPTHTH